MAVKARSVPLPKYPSILLKAKQSLSKEEYTARFEALVTYYGIAAEFGFGLAGFARVSAGDDRTTKDAWSKLAVALLCDFVPAFRIARKRGRRRKHYALGVQSRLALALTGYRSQIEDQENADQAQFVLAVRRAKGNDSLNAAFERLATDRRRNELPELYQSRKTPGSLKDLWKRIDKRIKDDPESYLKPPPSVAGGLLGLLGSTLNPTDIADDERQGTETGRK